MRVHTDGWRLGLRKSGKEGQAALLAGQSKHVNGRITLGADTQAESSHIASLTCTRDRAGTNGANHRAFIMQNLLCNTSTLHHAL